MSRRTNLNTVRTDFCRNSFWSHDKVYTQILWYDIKINEYLTGIFYSLKIPTSNYVIRRFFNHMVIIETDMWIFGRDRFVKFLPNKYYYYYLLHRIRVLFRRFLHRSSRNPDSRSMLHIVYYLLRRHGLAKLTKLTTILSRRRRAPKSKRAINNTNKKNGYDVKTGRKILTRYAARVLPHSYDIGRSMRWYRRWATNIRTALRRNDLEKAYYWYYIDAIPSRPEKTKHKPSVVVPKKRGSDGVAVTTSRLSNAHKRIKSFRHLYLFISAWRYQYSRKHMRMRLRMRRAAISRGIILPIPRAKYKLLAAYAETLRNVYSRRSIWHVSLIYRLLKTYMSSYIRIHMINRLNRHLLHWLYLRRINAKT